MLEPGKGSHTAFSRPSLPPQSAPPPKIPHSKRLWQKPKSSTHKGGLMGINLKEKKNLHVQLPFYSTPVCTPSSCPTEAVPHPSFCSHRTGKYTLSLAKTTDVCKEKRDDPKSFQCLTPFLSEPSSEHCPKLCHIIWGQITNKLFLCGASVFLHLKGRIKSSVPHCSHGETEGIWHKQELNPQSCRMTMADGSSLHFSSF